MMTQSPYEKPLGGLELWGWVFMRVSGVALIFLALGHFAIMHLVHPIEELSYDFVAGRYQYLRWRLYDLFLLLLAMVHGLNGVRILIDDYVHHPVWHRRVTWMLRIVGFVFIVLGIFVILFFQPEIHG